VAAAEPYGVYDPFAWFYNQGWGNDYHQQSAPLLDRHVFPRLAAGARVLDVCCGIGDLSRVLAARGYQVTGIDGSEEMLRFARQRTPGAEFRLADARRFSVGSHFDAALSTYDSLNHILDPEELESAFSSVLRALVPGGLFVFDMNTEESFETLWCGSSGSVDETSAGITRASYDPVRKVGRADLTLFRQVDGAWRRSDITVFERCYSVEDVTAALERAGFAGIEERPAGKLGMQGDMAVGRVFFFAIRS
jgi:SAM-dependent methyltransferase